jgi:hypothetical protein
VIIIEAAASQGWSGMMIVMETKLRRWLRPQFSLRLLFLMVAISAAYLGLQTKWIHDRRAARIWVHQHNGTAWMHGEGMPPPWGLGLFGENGCSGIVIADTITEDDPPTVAKRMKKLFPEASVYLFSPTTYKWRTVD